MALVTAPVMWLAPGVTVSVTADDVTGLVSAVTVDNPTGRPALIVFTVGGARREVTIPARAGSVPVPAPVVPVLGQNVSIAGAV